MPMQSDSLVKSVLLLGAMFIHFIQCLCKKLILPKYVRAVPFLVSIKSLVISL